MSHFLSLKFKNNKNLNPEDPKAYTFIIIRLLRDKVIVLHGMLVSIILNRDPRFILNLARQFYKVLKIRQNIFTAAHFKTNNQLKRTI